jgi:N-acetylglucosamine-6-phosphate deacetylase
MVHGNDGASNNEKAYDNQVWWAYAEHITLQGTTGTLPTITTTSGT